MTFKCNEKGEFFCKKSRNEINKLLFISPVVICFLSFLYMVGAKNKMHLIFAIVMSCFLLLIIALGFVSLLQKVNHTIRAIDVTEDEIVFVTFSVLFLQSKTYRIKNSFLIKSRKQEFFVFNKRQISKGWVINVGNHNLKLIEEFFNDDIRKHIMGLT